MKKYKHIAQQLQRWQKYGIAKGIIFLLKEEMRSRGLDFDEWLYEYGNGYKEHRVTFVVPTPSAIREVLDYPYFEYDGDYWYIDMIHFDDELQVHLMGYDNKKSWTNGGWHTVREGLNLNDTMVLYEYINDRKSNLIILDKDNSDKYNSTGALDVGMF